MLNIALVCHSPAYILQSSRKIELNNLKKIEANETFFIDTHITKNLFNFIRIRKNIKMKSLKIKSILVLQNYLSSLIFNNF